MAKKGRPKQSEPTVCVCLRLTEKERYDLKVIAADKDVNINTVVREWIKHEQLKSKKG